MKSLCILTVLLCVFGCSEQKDIIKYNEFDLIPRLEKLQNGVRHDGIYYQNYVNSSAENDTSEWNRTAIRIFFEDGTFVNFSQPRSKVKLHENPCVSISQNEREFILSWGIYDQTGDTLVIQKIHPQRGLFKKFDKEELIATVNDNSVTFIEKRMPQNRSLKMNENYSFAKCNSMPSSENVFIDNLMESRKK